MIKNKIALNWSENTFTFHYIYGSRTKYIYEKGEQNKTNDKERIRFLWISHKRDQI